MPLVLPYNTTSINASFPVGHGLISALVVIVFTAFNFMFVVTTLLTLFYGSKNAWRGRNGGNKDDKEKKETSNFFAFDVIIGTVIWAGAAVAIFVTGVVNYNKQLTDGGYSFYHPQDASNITEAVVCLWMLMLWKFAMLYDASKGKVNQIEGTVEPGEGQSWGRAVFFSLWTSLTLAFLCLWPAIYGYTYALGGNGNFNRHPYTNAGGWFTPVAKYTGVPAANLASGIILLAIFVFYFTIGRFLKDVTIYTGGSVYRAAQRFTGNSKVIPTPDVVIEEVTVQKVYYNAFSYKSKLFSGVEGFESEAVVKGWIPAHHLPLSFILAFCFYTGAADMFTKYDLIKTTEFFFCVCVIPLFLCALSQTVDYFFAYHVAARFWFLAIQYFAGAVLTTSASLVAGAGPMDATGSNLDYGMYLSGPANGTDTSNGLVDPTTVMFTTYFALSVTILSAANVFWKGEIKNVNSV